MDRGVDPLPLGSPRRVPAAMQARANISPQAPDTNGPTCAVTVRAATGTVASTVLPARTSAARLAAAIAAPTAPGAPSCASSARAL